jgi:isocitrate dehydrogenase
LAATNNNPKAQILADSLDDATEKLLENGKSPSRIVRELDNRGSHFYLALYWAEALANQTKDADLKAEFTPIAKELAKKETIIVHELNQIQGSPVDIGGYYKPNETLINQSMRPSRTFNSIID